MPNKIKITPGQALLVLLDAYAAEGPLREQLKKHYLCGAETEEDRTAIEQWFTDPALASYKIVFDKKSIDDDPTRRYFETHLAYHTLDNGLDTLPTGELELFLERITKELKQANREQRLTDLEMGWIEEVLAGHFDDNSGYPEYAFFIKKLQEKTILSGFSAEETTNLLLLTKLAFVNTYNSEIWPLPMDVYSTGVYETNARGKIDKSGMKNVRNPNWGLLKGHMPVASDDIARAPTELPYLKSSDKSTYREGAKWVESSFDKWVHPFSNSISGTVLATLRTLLDLKDRGGNFSFLHSIQPLENYLRLTISARALAAGGHSLNEYSAPIFLQETRREFSGIAGFDKLDLMALFYEGNQLGFDTALQETIAYNKRILYSKSVSKELVELVPNDVNREPTINHILALEDEHRLRSQTPEYLASEEEYLQIGLVFDAFIAQENHYRDAVDQLKQSVSQQLMDLILASKHTKQRDPLLAIYKNLIHLLDEEELSTAEELVAHALDGFSRKPTLTFWKQPPQLPPEALETVQKSLLKLQGLKNHLGTLEEELREFDRAHPQKK